MNLSFCNQPSGPKLGELIWGRMPGFSYWPCFVTKSPDGEHRRDKGSAGRVEFHVQVVYPGTVSIVTLGQMVTSISVLQLER